ncbi:MAG: hypothetical protein K2X82_05360 [Gemmataceae bacterium]|nr:hypothetical protein [Gemmataceae bacterium]
MIARLAPALAAVALVVLAPAARAGFVFPVTFDDPGGGYAAYYRPIAQHVAAAGAIWDRHLGGEASLEVVVKFDPGTPRATGRSLTSSFAYQNWDGRYVYHQGAGAEIRDGVDPNGADPDIEIVLGPGYLRDELWFDPRPFARTAPVPTDRTDAVSVFLHELGHAIGFNGWRDLTTGQLPPTYASTYEAWSFNWYDDVYFYGPNATAAYGGRYVPLTRRNWPHVGNWDGLPGDDLLFDLMNGEKFYRGYRFDVSALDVAILADLGLPLQPAAAVPEPMSVGLLAVGGLLAARRARRPVRRT